MSTATTEQAQKVALLDRLIDALFDGDDAALRALPLDTLSKATSVQLQKTLGMLVRQHPLTNMALTTLQMLAMLTAKSCNAPYVGHTIGVSTDAMRDRLQSAKAPVLALAVDMWKMNHMASRGLLIGSAAQTKAQAKAQTTATETEAETEADRPGP
jgi:hypothetical protein